MDITNIIRLPGTWISRSVAILLVVLTIGLQHKLWNGPGGIAELLALKREIANQIQDNQILEERNKALAAEVIDLKTGVAAIEERGRLELGMIKSDETFFLVVNKPHKVDTRKPNNR